MQITALQKKTTTSLNSNNQMGTAILPAVLVYQQKPIQKMELEEEQPMQVKFATQAWLPTFDFLVGVIWNGLDIPDGTVVGFYRVIEQKIFHASISVGGTVVCGINGDMLGTGRANGARDLSTLVRSSQPKTHINDGTDIIVYLSNL